MHAPDEAPAACEHACLQRTAPARTVAHTCKPSKAFFHVLHHGQPCLATFLQDKVAPFYIANAREYKMRIEAQVAGDVWC